jgi:hypothetical protein
MRARAAILHGSLKIDSAPGAGTLLTAELPIEKKLPMVSGAAPPSSGRNIASDEV